MSRPRSTTPAQDAEIVAWARSRMTVQQKAAQYGISTSTLENILARHGLEYAAPATWKEQVVRAHEREARA